MPSLVVWSGEAQMCDKLVLFGIVRAADCASDANADNSGILLLWCFVTRLR